jgi:hypothetical protein
MICGIRTYMYDYTDDDDWDNIESPGDALDYCTYTSAGSYTVRLKVWDHDSCYGLGSDKPSECTVIVTAVEVDKIVKQGTTNEGPLYTVCPGDTVTLEAKPNPSGADFPSLAPQWTLEKPEGSNAFLTYSWGSTTTLQFTDVPGEYIVTAKCGDYDSGDTITVIYPPTSGYWESFLPTTACPPWPWQGRTKFTYDDCENMLGVYCDEENSMGDEVFSWWYRPYGQTGRGHRGRFMRLDWRE